MPTQPAAMNATLIAQKKANGCRTAVMATPKGDRIDCGSFCRRRSGDVQDHRECVESVSADCAGFLFRLSDIRPRKCKSPAVQVAAGLCISLWNRVRRHGFHAYFFLNQLRNGTDFGFAVGSVTVLAAAVLSTAKAC